MELKARGNALFRDGDFRGASNAFRRAMEGAEEVSDPGSDAAEFKVACLCNLAYACIKLGSMDEAEEACSQALHMRRANAKALFRRGQARLALGRPIEAASDFSEVCLLEPYNAEAARMLRLAHAEEENARGWQETSPPAVGISPGESEDGKSEPAAPTTHSSEEVLPLETTRDGNSNNRVKPEKAEAGGSDVGQKKKVESSDISSTLPVGPSFMVAGWLDSAERKQGQRAWAGGGDIGDHPRHLDGSANPDRSPVSRPGGAGGATSVSRLVSQLSLAQKGTSKNTQDEPVASGPAAPGVQAEWSRLQAEEDIRVQESLRRWSTGGGLHAQEKTTKAGVKGKLVDAEEGKLEDNTATKIKSKTVPARTGGSKEVKRASELWASLEEEELRVREAFRAKLGVSGKLSSKERVKEKKRKEKKELVSPSI